MSRSSHRVTLADIAKHLGVSTATVSLALNGKPGSRIPEETVRKVREAARELGYRPNTLARALKTGRTHTIGFLSNEVTTTRFASPMITGIVDEAEQLRHAVMMAETGHRSDRFAPALRTLESRNVDGVVVGLMASRELDLPKTNLPLVICNGQAGDLPAILPDDYAAGRDAIDYLVARGHRSIALIGRFPEAATPSFSISERMRGIDAALAHHGIRLHAEGYASVWEPASGYARMSEILNDDPANYPTAVLAANDRLALGVYQAMQDAGLDVASTISVLSFDDEDLAALVRPGLTTFRLPYQEMGARAARMLVDLLSGEQPEAENPTLLPLKVVERASVSQAR